MQNESPTVKVLARGVRIDDRSNAAGTLTLGSGRGCGSAGECLVISPQQDTPPVAAAHQ